MVWVPSAAGTKPAATDAAEPLDERRAYGFLLWDCGFPGNDQANSVVTFSPLRLRRVLHALDPQRVALGHAASVNRRADFRRHVAVSMMSLIAMGIRQEARGCGSRASC